MEQKTKWEELLGDGWESVEDEVWIMGDTHERVKDLSPVLVDMMLFNRGYELTCYEEYQPDNLKEGEVYELDNGLIFKLEFIKGEDYQPKILCGRLLPSRQYVEIPYSTVNEKTIKISQGMISDMDRLGF